jgi:hypothetical protein
MENLELFLRLAKDLMRAWPQPTLGKVDLPCDQWQTLALLWSTAELNSENLGKTYEHKDSPYFYSRPWEQANFPQTVTYNYPALFFVMDRVDITEQRTLDYYFHVFAAYPANSIDCHQCGPDHPCNQRTPEEISAALRRLTMSFFNELENFVQFHDGSNFYWGHPDQYPGEIQQGHELELFMQWDVNNIIPLFFEMNDNLVTIHINDFRVSTDECPDDQELDFSAVLPTAEKSNC